MANEKLKRVVVGQDNDHLDFRDESDVAAIGGLKANVTTGEQGLAYAGAGGHAHSILYGIAVVGPKGTAVGGAGTVVCAYDGGSARGGNGAVAWARRDGPAEVGENGVAIAIDSTAWGGKASVAIALRQNARNVTAHAASEGIAVVRNHPALAPISRPATSCVEAGGIAVAFDDNWVKGALGSLLVAAYSSDGQFRFAVGMVDGVNLKPNTSYAADGKGGFNEKESED